VASESPDSAVREIRREGGAVVVEAAGDIDLHRSVEFQQSLAKVVATAPRRIIINLADVPYMDSSGLASLVKLLSQVRRANIELKLCSLTERVRSMFEITRLDSVFKICLSEQEALG